MVEDTWITGGEHAIISMAPDHHLLVGTIVKIMGLQAKPELNGCAALVGSFNAEKGRYNVRVISPEKNDYVEVALKPDNLEQGAAARLPPASMVEADSYAIKDVLDVMDALDSMEEYHADVAVASLTRCVESLMEGPSAELPASRVLMGAMNALRTNARNDGTAPQLFGVAILNLPFLLGSQESAPMVDAAEAKLECSLLRMLTQGLGWYEGTPELLASTMIALRQLLGCWIANDDTVDFRGVDEPRVADVLASGMVPALVKMLAASPPTLEDEGTLELHEHAIAAFSALCGLQPSAARARALVEAGAVAPTLAAMAAVAEAAAGGGGKRGHGGPKGGKHKGKKGPPPPKQPSTEAMEAALELVRAAGALLKALGGTAVGRDGLRAAGAIGGLSSLLRALPHPAVVAEMGALRSRLESTTGEDVTEAMTSDEHLEASQAREAVPSFVSARRAGGVAEGAASHGAQAAPAPDCSAPAHSSGSAGAKPARGGAIEATYLY